VTDLEPPLRDGNDVDMTVVRVVVADCKPVDAPPEVLLELRHDALRPEPKIQAATEVLVLGVRREYQPIDVVRRLDAIEAGVGTLFSDPAYAVPHLAVLVLAMLVAAMDGVTHVALGQA